MKKILVLAVVMCMLALVLILHKDVEKVDGKFYAVFDAKDEDGNTNTYYQFRSDDDSVWWILTEEKLGFVPKENVKYVLTYDNNSTTEDNKNCGCSEDLDCECYKYDDIFIKMEEK